MASRQVNGVAIRELRKALGISLTELATAVGVDKSAMSRIETGSSQTRPDTVRKIAVRLGVPLDAISHTVPAPEDVAS